MSRDSQLEEGRAAQVAGEDGEPSCKSLLFFLVGQILYWLLYATYKILYWSLYLTGKILFWSLIVVLVILLVIFHVIKFVLEIMMRTVFKPMIKLAIKKKIFLLLSVIAIISDPLFFYIPVLNDEKKCIEMDKILGTTAIVLRSVLDLFKIIHFIFELLTKLPVKGRMRVWLFFLIDILATLPLPQVLLKLQKVRGTEFLYAMSFFLIQYLLRVIRTYYLFTEATGVTGILAEATWAIVGFNILLYMHGGHVFGALWYFYAIGKLTGCWKKACQKNTGCHHSSFYCEDMIGTRGYTFLNDFCSIKSGNTSDYNFGLYTDALESGIVEVTNFPKKLLHCLQWGLQNLSAFGQNLQTSTDIWENIFAICMTNFGVVLFVFLIGKMQSDTARSHKIRKKWKEIKQWPNFGEISSDVKGQLRKYKREKWQETKRVDVDNLVNDLPHELGNKIKRKLCIKLIKNVKEFENWSEKSLGYLCEFLKPVFFIERTRIIREGDPIDEMLFVLKGNLWTYTSRNATTTSSSNRRCRENHMKDGDFFGEELIAWAQNERSSNLPISARTIQALSDVEAFILMADDLKHVLSLRHCDQAALLLQSRWRFRKFLRDRRRAKQKSSLRKLLDWAAAQLQ